MTFQFGDFDETMYKPGMLAVEDLLPQRVIDQYQMTAEMWEDRIKTWWMNNKGMTRYELNFETLLWYTFFIVSGKKPSSNIYGSLKIWTCMESITFQYM